MEIFWWFQQQKPLGSQPIVLVSEHAIKMKEASTAAFFHVWAVQTIVDTEEKQTGSNDKDQ